MSDPTSASARLIELEEENRQLTARVLEAEETLRAIQDGEVDAVVVRGPDRDQVFTLRGAEHPYRVMVEEMSEGAVSFTGDGMVLYCNHRFAELLGRPLESIIGASIETLVGRESARLMAAAGEAGTVELDLPVAGGSAPVKVSMRSLVDEGIDITCAVVTDLSVVRAGIEARLRLAAIVESSHDAIVAQGTDGVIQDWNTGAEALYGWTAAEAIGGDHGLIIPEERLAPALAVFRRAAAGHNWSGEARRRCKNGREVDVLLTLSPIRSADGRVVGVSSISRDITERKAAELALREYGERLKILHEVDHAILATRSVDDIAARAVAQVRALLGYHRVSLLLFETLTQEAVVLAVDTPAATRLVPGERIALEDVLEATDVDRVNVIDDLEALTSPTERDRSLLADGVRSVLTVPLQAEGRRIGALVLGRSAPGPIDENQVHTARQVADSLAVALQHARLFSQVRSSRERLQVLSRRLIEIQEEERRGIALELHDEAGQSLTTLLIGLGLLEREISDPAVVAKIHQLKATTDAVMEGLHRLAMRLRPASLDRLGLASALQRYLEAVRSRNGLVIDFEAIGFDDSRRMPLELETTMFRVVQEAVTNVSRHAGATRLSVVLEHRPESVMAVIEDDGAGFDVKAAMRAGRLGLLGMYDRVEMVGGTVRIESQPGKGATVVVELPLT